MTQTPSPTPARSSTPVVLGLDIGATKLAVVAETLDGQGVLDVRLDSGDWNALPVERAADWIVARLGSVVPADLDARSIVIGAQGCDSTEHCERLANALRTRGIGALVVNDGELLVPAAGLDTGFGIIAGTGSVGIGHDANGTTLFAGGWGWAIGDEGGGAGLVREATRAALLAYDEGEPDDGLFGLLQKAFGVRGGPELARAVNDEPTVANWAPKAPVVFEAADAGSAVAARVIDEAGARLARLVSQLVTRGAVGRHAVVAGGVITKQARLLGAFTEALHAARPDVEVVVLGAPPVAGAVRLAHRAHRAPDLHRRLARERRTRC